LQVIDFSEDGITGDLKASQSPLHFAGRERAAGGLRKLNFFPQVF
jgi:hypothetical protein